MEVLIAGENVKLKMRPSRLVSLRCYAIALVLFVLAGLVGLNFYNIGSYLMGYSLEAAGGLAGLGIIIAALAEIRRLKLVYLVTDHRVVRIEGILRKVVDSCMYGKIVNVKLMASFLDRLLGIGTIDITTFKRTEILLLSVRNPSRVERLIYDMIEKKPGEGAAPARPEPQVQAPQKQPQQPQGPPAQNPQPPGKGTA